ncbi:MAG TPA: STAS domain-containing protein [Candidatus Sulfotelmatobacter sp.]|nr:STAS domain-containing protein [Candidatus Sulfotelmatobacter sp.]
MSPQSSLTVLKLTGELDIAQREAVQAALQLDAGGGPVLIDLSEVSYADSTVISQLLRFRNEAEARGRKIALLIGSPQFRRLLQYAGLGDAFAVFDDRGRALTFLAGGPA